MDVWITRKMDTVNIMITNWALPLHPIKTEIVKVHLENIKKVKASFIERIDDDHANATKTWKNMGSPQSLTPNEVSTLEVASALIMEPFATKDVKGSVFVEVTVPHRESLL